MSLEFGSKWEKNSPRSVAHEGKIVDSGITILCEKARIQYRKPARTCERETLNMPDLEGSTGWNIERKRTSPYSWRSTSGLVRTKRLWVSRQEGLS